MGEMRSSDAHVAFVLGAGASKGAGLQTSAELFRTAQQFFRTTLKNPDARRAYEDVATTLEGQYHSVNIEDFLSAVRALAERKASDLFALTAGLREPYRSIDERLLDGLYYPLVYYLKDQLSPRDRGGFLRPYLRRLARLALESRRPTFLTLNYDLCMETVLEAEGIAYATGFRKPSGIVASYLPEGIEFWPLGYEAIQIAHLEESYFGETPDSTPARARLIKVHGSVDWYRISMRPIYEGGLRLSPEDRIVRLLSEPAEGLPMMIAGAIGKERLEEPFTTLYRHFYHEVLSTEVLVVIGYSFSDAHINKILVDAQLLERDHSYDLIVINGKNWPRGECHDNRLSERAKVAWNLLVRAGRQSAELEYLSEVRVLPYYAEEAIEGGHLERALSEIVEQRRYRGP